MSEHQWKTIEPPHFKAEAICERYGLSLHVLNADAAFYSERGAKRSWRERPSCPPPPPGPDDGSNHQDDADNEAMVERCARGELDWMTFGPAGGLAVIDSPWLRQKVRGSELGLREDPMGAIDGEGRYPWSAERLQGEG